MRRSLLLWPLLLVTGCQKDFDEKYDDTEQQLKADAKRLDDQMAAERKKELKSDSSE